MIKRFYIILLIFITLFFSACANKPTQTEYIYKDVNIPIRCNAKMPSKPITNGSFGVHKELMIYYIKVESLLKECLGIKDEK